MDGLPHTTNSPATKVTLHCAARIVEKGTAFVRLRASSLLPLFFTAEKMGQD